MMLLKLKARGSQLFFLFLLLILYCGISFFEKELRDSPRVAPLLNNVTFAVADHAGRIFRLSGSTYETVVHADGTQLIVNDKPSVFVGYSCNGISLFILFTAFIAAAGGPVRSMAWFIPAGWLSIHLVNVVRVWLLAVIFHYRPEWVDFNHKYVFTIVVYSWVFLLFKWWIDRVKKENAKSNAELAA